MLISSSRPCYFFCLGMYFSMPKRSPRCLVKHYFKIIKIWIHFLFYKLLKIKICRFGVSVGSLNWVDGLFEKIQAALSHFYSLWESVSEGYVRNIGINQVKKFLDGSFLLPLFPGEINLRTGWVVCSFRRNILG